MASRTPVQSNVLGFEEILSSGDNFLTPRASFSSNGSGFTTRPVVKTTTVTTREERRHASGSHRKSHRKSALSTSICNKCGKCESCDKRQLQSPSRPTKNAEAPLSPTSVGTHNRSQREATTPFQPQFITELAQSSRTSKQGKWEAVKAITETIIKEKDMLIERQKLKRLQLEQQVRDLESKLRKVVLGQSVQSELSAAEESSKQQLEREEQAYRRMTSSATLLSDNNSYAKVLMEKCQIERQLGQSEHKIAELKCLLLTQKSDMQQQIEYYKKLLDLSQEQEQAMESKNDTMKAEGDHATKELSRLKLYLADLPTKEEFTELNTKLSQTEAELATNGLHIESLVDERTNAQTECKRLNNELGESNDQVLQLLSQVSLLQKEISVWEHKEMLRDTSSGEDIVKLKEQQLELHTDYENSKQLLTTRQQEFDSASRDYETQMSDLTNRLEQAETLLQGLQDECADKDSEIEYLSKTLQQVKEENQELSDKSLANEEKVKVAEEMTSGQTCKLEQTLVEEIVYCTSSLECLVEMYNNPHSLDLADMLATRPTPVTISSPREYIAVLEQETTSLKSMSEKIEKLRQFVLDKYADDMVTSGHVECATQ